VHISFGDVAKLVTELGVVKGLFVFFFVMMHAWVFWLYKGRLEDRQEQIDRIAAENKDYRDRFTSLIDKKLNIPKGRLPPAPPKSRKKGR
jgi:hypothetical protein